ncbi:MFS transporter [Allonocardiopsis opalescens]|uniref:Na+/melibiose symporter-like transporter n=1 Tax=Allonocardiopsis opalescens TaxID=1144618 RepID=A0A2T0QEX3_9ACTN|nr:MFS transporter [Allonocardiopsis opalescens]PRY02494.1 Na+/melibiose symporter-like transporter [Allonocardiopsis opalescens]
MTALDAPAGRTAGRTITFFVVLAVFAQESTWNFYDAQVPPLLREYVASAALVGALMGMDNLLGIFVQPWIGNRSDNTRTRWGRRIPYLAVGMPVAALLFASIPLAGSLPVLIALMFAYALVCNSFKPIAEALLPDYIRPERRSRANAAVKAAASLTIVVSALISLFLVDSYPVLSFSVPALLMLVSAAVLVACVRDSTSPAYRAAAAEDAAANGGRAEGAPPTRMRDILSDIIRDPNRERLLIIVAILLFGCAWAASRSLVTPYGMEALGLSRGSAGGLTLPSGVAFILAAFPVALLSERIGRLRVMAAGMALFAAALTVGALVNTPTAAVVALCVGAVGASGFLVNAAVILWNLAPSAGMFGVYTGLYTVGWASGGFLGPTLVGAMVEVTGWRFMPADAALLAALAVAVVLRVLVLSRRAAAARVL